MITNATPKERKEALQAYQYYRSVGHTPESAWRLARVFITRILKG